MILYPFRLIRAILFYERIEKMFCKNEMKYQDIAFRYIGKNKDIPDYYCLCCGYRR